MEIRCGFRNCWCKHDIRNDDDMVHCNTKRGIQVQCKKEINKVTTQGKKNTIDKIRLQLIKGKKH